MKLLCFLFLLLNICFANVLTTTISSNKVALGDTFNLTIDAQKDSTTAATPDIVPLQRDFMILGTSENQSLEIYNGNAVQKNQWIISLTPKISGKLTIPSITVGNNKTAALTINVAATQAIKANGQQGVFIDASVSPKDPYVQSEILYKMRVYYDVSVSAASIDPPQAKNAIINQLGNDQTYDTTIKGKTYQVFERNFLIFPQTPGKLVISPAVFRGAVADTAVPAAFAGFTDLDVKPIQLIAPAFTLSVKPIPAAAGSHWWLPSSNLTATETWSATATQIKKGAPLTRTIVIKAAGLMATQLPQIANENSATYNSYANQPELNDTLENNQLFGIKTERIVYIPTASGSVTFPAVTIHWWNTKTNALETTVLPSKNFTVLAAANPATVEATAAPITKLVTKTATPVLPHTNRWLIIALVFLFLWLITILLCWLLWRNKLISKKQPSMKFEDLTTTDKTISLKQACERNDPHAAKKALILWAQHQFNHSGIHSIADILPHIQDPLFLQELTLLQNKLYNQTEMVWPGKKLWECWKSIKIKKNNVVEKKEEFLPSLYPE